MSHLYFSYSAVDRPIIMQIADALESDGYRTWVDERVLSSQPEANWVVECQNALENCARVVAIVSINSVGLSRVRREWDWSFNQKRPCMFLSMPIDALETNSDRYIAERRIPVQFRDINFIRHDGDVTSTLNAIRANLGAPGGK